jgi:DUF4097 and DUF4098 domain-containing protein YvlB
MAWPAPANVAVVRISTTSGSVRVTAEPDRTEVWSSSPTMSVEESVTIDGGSSKVEVRVPEGTDLVIGTISGKVTVDGRVGAVSVLTTSGRICVDHAVSVDARSTSGRVEVAHSDGECRVMSTSGRVQVGRCGAADAASGSGRIVLADAHGPVRANCTSGRITVSMAGAHDVDAETVSGRVEISFPAGVRPLVVSSVAAAAAEAGQQHDCNVIARSGSSRVTVSNR